MVVALAAIGVVVVVTLAVLDVVVVDALAVLDVVVEVVLAVLDVVIVPLKPDLVVVGPDLVDPVSQTTPAPKGCFSGSKACTYTFSSAREVMG